MAAAERSTATTTTAKIGPATNTPALTDSTSAAVVQVNISPGGMPKRPVAGAARVTFGGIEGDWQTDRRYHGGADRAVCLFSQELYARLRDEHGIELFDGAVGENFTTCGIDLDALAVGDRMRVGGSVVVEITGVRVPCRNLHRWDRRLLKAITGHSGWVCRVVEEGLVRAGDGIQLMRGEG